MSKNELKSYFKEDSKLYKNWLIEPYKYGWRIIPITFTTDEDLYRWYNNGFCCTFTTLKSAKEYISSNRSICYYNEVIEYFEKVRNK